MKKFITLCGFLILGSIACGDADVVKAEAINEQTTDTFGYTIIIPSDVDIDKDSGKGSFAVKGKVKAQSTIDVSIQSKNGYKLKDKNGELPYSIDKKSFSIDNSRSASDISLNAEFNIVSKTNTKVSGYYTDSLTFDITDKKYEYELDVNGNLDENGCGDGSLTKFGRFDVYIDGKLVKKDADDFCQCIPYGSTWELKNIRGLDGYHYEESLKIPTKGVIGKNIEDRTDKYRTTCVNLKFYTNKLIINYHADGAQTWNNFQNIVQDVSNKDIVYSETKNYGDTFDSQDGLVNVNRLTKKGYTAVANTWIIQELENKKVMDNVGLAKSQDVAEYCGVLDSFKKNDTTIDLYPEWIPNKYTLTLNPNGGEIYGSSEERIMDPKMDYNIWKGNWWTLENYIPSRTGYVFDGWYTQKSEGTKIYDINGDCSNDGVYWAEYRYKYLGNLTVYAHWKKQYTLTFDANGGTVSKTSRTITEGNQIGNLPTPNKDGYRFYGWYAISNGTDWQTSCLILGSSTMTQDLKIVASWGPPVETLAKQNENTLPDGVYKIYSGISSLSDYNLKPRLENSNDENQILLKKEDSSEYAFWQVEHDSSGFVMLKNRKTGKYLDLAAAFATNKRQIQLYSENGTYAQKWIVINKNGKYQIISAVNPNFVLDLSNATLDGGDYGVVQLYYDNGTAAQRWNFKKVQTPGTQINIENNTYTILKNMD